MKSSSLGCPGSCAFRCSSFAIARLLFAREILVPLFQLFQREVLALGDLAGRHPRRGARQSVGRAHQIQRAHGGVALLTLALRFSSHRRSVSDCAGKYLL
jgi:hypothetical protein